MNGDLMRAYQEAMRDLDREPLLFTARSGEQGTGEYFDQKWRAKNNPAVAENVIAFPVPDDTNINSSETEIHFDQAAGA